MKRATNLMLAAMLMCSMAIPASMPYAEVSAIEIEDEFKDMVETIDKTASAVRKDINQTYTFKSVDGDGTAVGNVKIKVEYKEKDADDSTYQPLTEVVTGEDGTAEYEKVWEWTTPETTYTYVYFKDYGSLSEEDAAKARAKVNAEEYWYPSLENLEEQWGTTLEAKKHTELKNAYVQSKEITIRYEAIEAPEGYEVTGRAGEQTIHIHDSMECQATVKVAGEGGGEDPDDPNPPAEPLKVEKVTRTGEEEEVEVEVKHKFTAKEIGTDKLLGNVPLEIYARKEGESEWELLEQGTTDSLGMLEATLHTTVTIPEHSIDLWAINRQYNPETEAEEYAALEEQYGEIIFPSQLETYAASLLNNKREQLLFELKRDTKYEYKIVNPTALKGYEKGAETVLTKQNGETLTNLLGVWDTSYYLKPLVETVPTYKVSFSLKSAANKAGIKNCVVTITNASTGKVVANNVKISGTGFSYSKAEKNVTYKYTIKGPTGFLTATGTFKVEANTAKTVYLNEVQAKTGKITPTKQSWSYTSKCTITTKGNKNKKAVKNVSYVVYRKYAGTTKFQKVGTYKTNKYGQITVTTKHSGSFTLPANYNYYTNYSSLGGQAKATADANIKKGKWFKTRAEAEAKYKADIKAKKEGYGAKLYNIGIKSTSVPKGYNKVSDTHFNVYVKTANSKKNVTIKQK